MYMYIVPLLQCYTAAELYSIYAFPQDYSLGATDLETICPALLQQIVSGHCSEEQEEEEESGVSDAESRENSENKTRIS